MRTDPDPNRTSPMFSRTASSICRSKSPSVSTAAPTVRPARPGFPLRRRHFGDAARRQRGRKQERRGGPVFALLDRLAGEQRVKRVMSARRGVRPEHRVTRVGHHEQARVRDLRRHRLRVRRRRAQIVGAAEDQRRHVRERRRVDFGARRRERPGRALGHVAQRERVGRRERRERRSTPRPERRERFAEAFFELAARFHGNVRPRRRSWSSRAARRSPRSGFLRLRLRLRLPHA